MKLALKGDTLEAKMVDSIMATIQEIQDNHPEESPDWLLPLYPSELQRALRSTEETLFHQEISYIRKILDKLETKAERGKIFDIVIQVVAVSIDKFRELGFSPSRLGTLLGSTPETFLKYWNKSSNWEIARQAILKDPGEFIIDFKAIRERARKALNSGSSKEAMQAASVLTSIYKDVFGQSINIENAGNVNVDNSKKELHVGNITMPPPHSGYDDPVLREKMTKIRAVKIGDQVVELVNQEPGGEESDDQS